PGTTQFEIAATNTAAATLTDDSIAEVYDPIYKFGEDYSRFIDELRPAMVAAAGSGQDPLSVPVCIMRPAPKFSVDWSTTTGLHVPAKVQMIKSAVNRLANKPKVSVMSLDDMEYQNPGVFSAQQDTLFPSSRFLITMGERAW